MIRQLAAAFSMFLLVLIPGSSLTAQESVTLVGEIEAEEYDEDGNVASVTIYDSEWGSVLVSNEGKGRELLSHVGAVAQVKGKIVELDDDSAYSYRVTVTSYTIEEPKGLDEDRDWDDPPKGIGS